MNRCTQYYFVVMSTPVVTDKWAGQFDCTLCRRKRLVAAEFSRTALEKHRVSGGPLKCKACVEQAQRAEQDAASAARQRSTAGGGPSETRVCAACQESLSADAYNRNQWGKGPGKSRCRSCVEKAVATETAASKLSKEQVIQSAREEVAKAKASGSSQAILKAESLLSALEAEHVTGLKPVKMSRGRGRARGRGRGRA